MALKLQTGLKKKGAGGTWRGAAKETAAAT